MLRFVRDTPGAESLGIAYAAAYLKAYLQTVAERGAPPAKDQVETYAANVLLVAPEDIRPKAA